MPKTVENFWKVKNVTKLLGLGPSAKIGAPKQECKKFMFPIFIRHGIFDALVVEYVGPFWELTNE